MPAPVLVLGASGGIGAATAQHLAGLGHPVIIHGRDRIRLEELSATIGSVSGLEVADLSKDEEVKALFSRIRSAQKHLAAVVFSVATPFRHRLAYRVSWSEFEEQLDSQLKALHLTATAAFPLLADVGETTRMVVISSEVVIGSPPPKIAAYVAAKAAMTAYSMVIAREWLRHHIRVHIVAPGLVKTSLTANMPDEFLELIAADMPERRLTSVDDVAAMVGFLLTEVADTLYGSPLRISRGERR